MSANDDRSALNTFGRRFNRRGLLVPVLLAGSVILASAQAPPGLVITSPAPGSVFNPGDSVTVVVGSPAGLSLKSLLVSGAWADLPVTMPASVTLTIPVTQRLGVGHVDATGFTTEGEVIEALSVRIAVERQDAPVSLSFEHRTLPFQSPGYDAPVQVKAAFADGAVLDVTESTKLSYSSSNPQVAIVDNINQVSALGAGNAVVTATYDAPPQPLTATIAVRVDPPSLTPVPAIVQYGSQPVGTSQTRSIALTNSHRFDQMTVRSVRALAPAAVFSAQSDCVERSPLLPGGTCTAVVSFSPSAPGPIRGVLEIQTSFSSIAEGVTLLGEGLGDPPVVLADLTSATSWLGLKNSDDQGTRFDLLAEVYRGGTLVSSALTRCIAGVTRNPNNALQVASPFADFTPETLTSGELLTLKLSTRIGTNPNDTKCQGHNNATGLRFYYDAPNRPSKLGVAFGTNAATDHYLHTTGGSDVLNTAAPTNATALYKDSPAVNFNGGNPWRMVGEWQLAVP